MNMPVLIDSIRNPSKKEAPKVKTEERKYKDPLNSWGIRALMYSTEVGATVNEIAPNLTLTLWAPAFMYLGADIYDKYKNDKNEFSPSSKRGLKEVIRQSLTFFILPSAATILGQKLTSPIGKYISDKLSINAKDGVYRHSKNVIEQCLPEDLNDRQRFYNIMQTSVNNQIDNLNEIRKTEGPLNKFYKYLTGYFAMADENQSKLHYFTKKNAENIFDLKEKLKNNVCDKNIPKRVYKKYKTILQETQKVYGNDNSEYAIKTALKEYQNHLIVKNKVLKTLGGVISCLLFTQPISYLVNKILMPKYITPGMEIVIEKFKESNLIRQHAEKVDLSRKKELQAKHLLNVQEKNFDCMSDLHKPLYNHPEMTQEDLVHKAPPQISQPHSAQEQKPL